MPGRYGRRADLARRHLHVLVAHGLNHIFSDNATRPEFLRIQPDAHAIVAHAEDLDLAHTRDTCQFIFDSQVDKVGEKEIVVAIVRTGKPNECGRTGGFLFDRHPDALHILRQAGDRGIHAILS